MILGRYEILGVAGAGAHGVVYRARDLRTGRVVAAKHARDERDGRHEASILERLPAHPGLPSLLDAGSEPGSGFWFVMPWIDGAPLARAVTRLGLLNVSGSVAARHFYLELVLLTLRSVTDALCALRTASVEYGGDASGNVWMTSSRVVLLDFVCSHVVADGDANDSRTVRWFAACLFDGRHVVAGDETWPDHPVAAFLRDHCGSATDAATVFEIRNVLDGALADAGLLDPAAALAAFLPEVSALLAKIDMTITRDAFLAELAAARARLVAIAYRR